MQRSRAGEQALADPVRPRERDRAAPHAITGLTGTLAQSVAATVAVAALLSYLALTPLAPLASDTYANDLRRHIILGAYHRLLRAAPPRNTPPARRYAAGCARACRDDCHRTRRGRFARPTCQPGSRARGCPRSTTVLPGNRPPARGRSRAAAGRVIAAVTVASFALASVWRQWQEWLDLLRAVEGGVSRASCCLRPSRVSRASAAIRTSWARCSRCRRRSSSVIGGPAGWNG